MPRLLSISSRAFLHDEWITNSTLTEAVRRLYIFFSQNEMKLVSQTQGDPLYIVAEQGSQFMTRFIGGWFVNPVKFPKRATLVIATVPGGVSIEALIEETLGFGILDTGFRDRYLGYFRTWLYNLHQLFPTRTN